MESNYLCLKHVIRYIRVPLEFQCYEYWVFLNLKRHLNVIVCCLNSFNLFGSLISCMDCVYLFIIGVLCHIRVSVFGNWGFFFTKRTLIIK